MGPVFLLCRRCVRPCFAQHTLVINLVTSDSNYFLISSFQILSHLPYSGFYLISVMFSFHHAFHKKSTQLPLMRCIENMSFSVALLRIVMMFVIPLVKAIFNSPSCSIVPCVFNKKKTSVGLSFIVALLRSRFHTKVSYSHCVQVNSQCGFYTGLRLNKQG